MRVLAFTATIFMMSLLIFVTWLALQNDVGYNQPLARVELKPPQTNNKVSEMSLGRPTSSYDRVITKTGVNASLQQGEELSGQPSEVMEKTTGQDNKLLTPVPIKALVEKSLFGPLPMISIDGRKPADVYSRPSNFTARSKPGEPAKIAILINGLGLSSIATHTAIHKLPGAITLGFGPYGHNLQGWVRKARELGHEVMLQIPFEPNDYPDNDPGPHTLLTTLQDSENLKRLQWLMSRFSGYIGVTNSMGAKFMSSEQSALPVLKEIKKRGLVYVEDGKVPKSAADGLTQQLGINFGVAKVIIDGTFSKAEIDKELARLESLALKRGLTIGMGSSLPVTVERIANWAKTLESKGIVLIPISAALRIQDQT